LAFLNRSSNGGIQEIFRKNRDRLYKWVDNREVPVDNNESEREIRLGVISRKVSFGSQSIEGAKIRGRMMSIIYTMKKRGIDPVKRIKYALDELAKNRNKDPCKLLFHSKPPD
jgi:transposase